MEEKIVPEKANTMEKHHLWFQSPSFHRTGAQIAASPGKISLDSLTQNGVGHRDNVPQYPRSNRKFYVIQQRLLIFNMPLEFCAIDLFSFPFLQFNPSIDRFEGT